MHELHNLIPNFVFNLFLCLNEFDYYPRGLALTAARKWTTGLQRELLRKRNKSLSGGLKALFFVVDKPLRFRFFVTL